MPARIARRQRPQANGDRLRRGGGSKQQDCKRETEHGFNILIRSPRPKEFAGSARVGYTRPVKRILRAAVVVLVLLVAAVIGGSFLVDANRFRPALEARLAQALRRTVTVGNLRLSLLSGGVAAEDVSVADDPAFSKDLFLKAKSVKVGVDLPALIFSRKLNVRRIAVESPEIALIETPAGKWNFSSLGAKSTGTTDPSGPAASSAPPDLSVTLLEIRSGRVTIANAGSRARPREFDDVEIELRDFSTNAEFPFTFSTKVAGGGEIKLDGKLGPISSTDTALTPLDAKLEVTHFDLASSRLLGNGAGYSGLVSIDGDLISTGQTADVNGAVKGEHLKLARNGSPASRTVELDFGLQHDLRNHTGTLTRADIHVGKAIARLSGTYTLTEDSANLNLRLGGEGMPVPELAAMLPAVGVVLPSGSSLEGGTAHANLAIAGPADRLLITGTLGLDNTKLAGFDLGSKMKLVAALAGIRMDKDTQIQTLSASVRSAPDGTEVQNIVFIAPTVGSMSGSGTIGAANALDFRMQAKLNSLGGGVPFSVRGTSSSPKFEPDVKGFAGQEIKSALSGQGGLLNGLLGHKKK